MDLAIVRLFRVSVLHDVVPCMPFPHHFRARSLLWANFNQAVWPLAFISNRFCVAASGDGFFWGFLFPSNQENVPIRQDFKVMVMEIFFIGKFIEPDHFTLRVELFESPSFATATKDFVAHLDCA